MKTQHSSYQHYINAHNRGYEILDNNLKNFYKSTNNKFYNMFDVVIQYITYNSIYYSWNCKENLKDRFQKLFIITNNNDRLIVDKFFDICQDFIDNYSYYLHNNISVLN